MRPREIQPCVNTLDALAVLPTSAGIEI